MNLTSLPGFPNLPAVAGLLMLKLTIVMALAGLLATLLRGRAAATRHLVWLVALAGALALPLLATMAPRLPVAVPAAASRALPRLVLAPPPASGVPALAGPLATAGPLAQGAAVDTPARPVSGRSGVGAANVLGLLWTAGFLAVVAWSLFGHLGLWGLHRSSLPVERQAWLRHYGLEQPATGAAGRAQLALSSVVGTPLTWGWLKPIVLLPSRSSAWPLERRRAALLHELAHVGRGDYLAQLLATVVCAVYWFHPLVWWAASRLRSESEHACDDRVLAAGMPAPAYASDLLAVAHAARGPGGSSLVAIGMARPSHLEGRLLAVLDEKRPRGSLRARAGLAALATTLLALVPFAGLTPHLLAASAAGVGTTHTDTREKASTQTHETTTTRTSESLFATNVNPAKSSKRSESRDADDPEHIIENTVPASPGGRIDLDLQTGGSIAIQGWDRREVYVRALLDGDDWRYSDVEIGPERYGVAVRSRQTHHMSSFTTSHEFVIKVPKRYDVHIQSAGGSVTIVGVEGTFDGNTGGGELVLERAKGLARLNTGGGEIRVSDCDMSGSVSTGGGVVTLSRVKGGLRGSSGSGPVIYAENENGDEDGASSDLTNLVMGGDDQIKVGSRSVGFLHVQRAGGSVDLDDVPRGGEIRTGGGDIQIRRGAGDLDVQTGGGDITLGPIAGSVRASTGAGQVQIALASVGGREQNVKVWSGTGKVIVELPADLNARLEVETAFTESYGRATKISSAWPLERAATTDWDMGQGTPRRHVRASGRAGRGDGLIYIRTVNGDIELRRAGGVVR